MSLSEFDIIQRYFTRKITPDPALVLGIGDDAALLRVPAGMELAVSVDTLVQGVHFPVTTAPADIGYKALAVNLSDMAAMGAEPRWATLALTLPEPDESWLDNFSKGFFELADQYGVQLIGGDTTHGPLSITIQMHGLVPAGAALRRAGARTGDLIYITGCVGDAGLALLSLQNKINLPPNQLAQAMARLNRPEPRIAQGIALRGIASAAIDVSDGLAADLSHILTTSSVGATLRLEDLPLSSALASVLSEVGGWNLPLTSGDDYELCFTVPPAQQARLTETFREFPCGCRCIGVVEAMPGLRCLANGAVVAVGKSGYNHFA